MNDATKSVIRHLLDGELPLNDMWSDREGYPAIVSDGVKVTPEEKAVLDKCKRKYSQMEQPKWTPETRRFMDSVMHDPRAMIRLRKRPPQLDGKIIMLGRRNFVNNRWLRIRWERDPILVGFFKFRMNIGKFEFVFDPISKKSWNRGK